MYWHGTTCALVTFFDSHLMRVSCMPRPLFDKNDTALWQVNQSSHAWWELLQYCFFILYTFPVIPFFFLLNNFFKNIVKHYMTKMNQLWSQRNILTYDAFRSFHASFEPNERRWAAKLFQLGHLNFFTKGVNLSGPHFTTWGTVLGRVKEEQNSHFDSEPFSL